MTVGQTIHKQGYLFKQGTYFSTWNERYFSLETSLLKQFTDADSPIPSYSIYLGTAVVDGVYSAANNSELGHGELWTMAIRYPLPTPADALEDQWGFMHIGSYDEKEIDEWFDSLAALIRVEQTKRLMASLGDSTPPEFAIASNRRQTSVLSAEMVVKLPERFTKVYPHFVDKFNSPPAEWTLESSIGGLLYRHAHEASWWKFSVAIPRAKAGVKRVWESLLGASVAAWEPAVKSACAAISDQDLLLVDNTQFLTDTWTAQTEVGTRFITSVVSCALDRLAFRDDKSGVHVVFAVPTEPDRCAVRHLHVNSLGWTAESVSDQTVVLTCFADIATQQRDFVTSTLCTVAGDVVAEALFRPAVVRIREFILSQ